MPTSARKHKPLRPPGQRVAKRNARKEEQFKCVLAPRFLSAPAPRESAIKPVPRPAAPVGKPSQTRRHHLTPPPPVSAEGHCTGARPSAFLFGPCTARFSFGKTKEKWGVHPRWTSPPAGAEVPVAAAAATPPHPAAGASVRPPPMTEFPRRQTAAPFHRKGRITPHAGHHPTTGI